MANSIINIDGTDVDLSAPYIKEIIKDIFVHKRNVLITGEGGTGKSVLIKLINLICNQKGIRNAVCSTTGASAVDINGHTIHSFAGVGIGDKEPMHYYSMMSGEKRRIIQKTKILTIDEISMLGDKLFDKIDELFELVRYENTDIHLYKSLVRKLTSRPEDLENIESDYLGINSDSSNSSDSNSDKNLDIRIPFGGIQFILVGDFLQLPPVKEKYIYKSKAWKQLNLKHHKLTNIYRFSNDSWCDLLGRVRKGEHTKEDIAFLQSRVMEKEMIQKLMEQQITPTILYSKRKDVDEINNLSLGKLETKLYKFNAVDIIPDELFTKNGRKIEKREMDYKLKSIKDTLERAVKEELYLKVGAQVMYLKNNRTQGLVNGSRGVITDISSRGIEVLFADGKTRIIGLASFEIKYDNKDIIRKQVPLTLAYAFSIHKIQGKTLDSAIIDLGDSVFANFQAYVAMSRVKDGNNLYLLNFNKRCIKVNQKIVDMYG